MDKGMVESVGFIFMMGLTIIISLMLFFLVTYQNDPGSTTVEQTIDYRVGEIEARAAVQTTMEGEIWRGVDNINEGDYNRLSVFKILSYWLSTPPDGEVYVNNQSYPEDHVKQNLTDYMQNRLSGIFVESRSTSRYYNMSVIYGGNRYEKEAIIVTPDQISSNNDFSMTTFRYPVAMRGSERAVLSISVAEGSGQ